LVRPKRTGKANALQFEPYEIRASIDPRPLQEEIERMRPKIERARQQAQKEVLRQTAALQRDIARQVRQSTMEAQRQIQLHRREIEEAQRAAQQATHELQLHQHEIEKAIQDSVRELGRSLDEI
jgi:Skp family chaperone for outer membrane proteins